jgi:hypothetical protein
LLFLNEKCGLVVPLCAEEIASIYTGAR